jgi:hypothetical protein
MGVDGWIENRVDGLQRRPVRFVPFAEAGADGSAYRTWVRCQATDMAISLLAHGTESRSAGAIPHGSAIDYERDSFATTHDDRDHDEDWFAVTLDAPVIISRVVYGHGRTWVNGGWFDSSDRPPELEIQTTHDGAWQSIGAVPGYPVTTAADPAGLEAGERFTLRLHAPTSVVGVRVRGRGSSGAYPPQRYATCSDLSAFDD